MLIDGESYFSHLAARLADMDSGDYLHAVGFRITPGVRLLPAASPPGPLLVDQLIDLIKRGVTVRIAVWYLPTSVMTMFYRVSPARRFNHQKDNVDIVKAVNAVVTIRGASAAILDQRLPFPFPLTLTTKFATTLASHHQKVVVLRSGGHDWAYVGSTDLAVDRWDTPTHASPPARAKEYWDAYHDVQCVVRGPAVTQVWENFRQRWNDRTPSAPPPTPLPVVLPSPIKVSPPVPASYGTHYVQVLRTLGCGVYPFAPRGEQTIRLALERAINLAEDYVYIEEQFLWPCSVVNALRKAVRRNPALKVIILLTEEIEFGFPLWNVHHEMRNEAIRDITGASKGQVFVYCLQQLSTKSPVYVHAKLTIIDDRYVALGSANVNKRSYTTDSELHLGIVDADIVPGVIGGKPTPVCRFARELRVSLWGEHLGITALGRLSDPVAAITEWPDWSSSTPQKPSRVHHAVCYHPRGKKPTAKELLRFLRALRKSYPILLYPTLPPPFDKFVDEAIALLEAAEQTESKFLEEITADFVLGGNYFLLKRLLRDFIMNIETTC